MNLLVIGFGKKGEKRALAEMFDGSEGLIGAPRSQDVISVS